MEIKLLKEFGDKYREQFGDIIHYSFRNWKRIDALKEFDNVDETKTIVGAFDNEKLQSSLIILELQMFVNNSIVKCGGIGAVATMGSDRKKGACTNIIKHSLDYMYKNNYVYSSLAPFSYEFYRKFGYELGYNSLEIETSFESISKFSCKGKIEILWNKENLKRIIPIYESNVKNLNGAIKRTEKMWENHFNLQDGDKTYAIYTNESNIDTGYLCMNFDQNETLIINEFFYYDIHSLKALLSFIETHSGQGKKILFKSKVDNNILDILPSKYIDTKLCSGMMIRVINAIEVLKSYHFTSNGKTIIQIKDNLIIQNNLILELICEDNKCVSLSTTEKTADIIIDIREFSQLMIGYRNIEDLIFTKTVEVVNEKAVEFFKHKTTTALFDFF